MLKVVKFFSKFSHSEIFYLSTKQWSIFLIETHTKYTKGHKANTNAENSEIFLFILIFGRGVGGAAGRTDRKEKNGKIVLRIIEPTLLQLSVLVKGLFYCVFPIMLPFTFSRFFFFCNLHAHPSHPFTKHNQFTTLNKEPFRSPAEILLRSRQTKYAKT